MSDNVYTPSAWGQAFHNLPHNEALGAGAAGVGKTMVLMFEFLQQLAVEHARCQLPESHPHHIAWGASRGWALFIRRTYKMLKQTIAQAQVMFKAVDPFVVWSEEDMMFTFSSGYKFQFGHCHKPGDWQQYIGNEYTLICFDELIQLLEQQYDRIRGRLRTSDPVLGKMLKCRAMSNPTFARDEDDVFTIDDPFWVRRRFIDPAPQGKTTIRSKVVRKDGRIEHRTRIYFPGTLYDNPDKEFVDNYELTLLEMKEADRQAMYHGNWYFQAGQYFTDVWNPQLHIVRPYVIPEEWPVFRSMDWGYKAFGFVHWWAINNEGTLICFHEMRFQLEHPPDVAKRILELEKRWGLVKNGKSIITGPADTQLWEERGDTGNARSKAEEFLAAGVRWEKADKRSRAANAVLMYRRLKDHKKGTTEPGLLIFSSCKELIRTVPMVPPSDPRDGTPDEPGAFKDDHAMDSAWYAHAWASRPHKAAKRGKRNETGDWEDERPKKQQSRSSGRYGYGQRVC